MRVYWMESGWFRGFLPGCHRVRRVEEWDYSLEGCEQGRAGQDQLSVWKQPSGDVELAGGVSLHVRGVSGQGLNFVGETKVLGLNFGKIS